MDLGAPTFECKKCGETTPRASGAQRYCKKCSPDSRRISGAIKTGTCKKCGGEYTRRSNNQRYCQKCSKYVGKCSVKRKVNAKPVVIGVAPLSKPKRTTPCCECGKKIEIRHNKIYTDDLRCPRCLRINQIRADKVRRRYRREWGKYLITRLDTYDAENEYRPFVSRRYVSKEEITEMLSRKAAYLKGVTHCYCMDSAEIVIENSWGYHRDYGYIQTPGFYRVPPMPSCEHPEHPYYDETVYIANSVISIELESSLCRRSLIKKQFHSMMRDKEDHGRTDAFIKRENALYDKRKLEQRKRLIMKTAGDASSTDFFRTMSAASAIQSKLTEDSTTTSNQGEA